MRLCFGMALAILLSGSAYGTSKDASQDPELSEEITDNDSITWLREISLTMRPNTSIDLTLPKEAFDEECLVRENGSLLAVDSLALAGVTVQKSSNFVSCRLTLESMTMDVIKTWELCGKSLVNEKVRCQRTTVRLLQFSNPTIRRNQTQPVHFGSFISSEVESSSPLLPVETCHVITPNGEDLIINSEEYPHIERIESSSSTCRIIIKDINREVLGHWTVYGRFFSSTFVMAAEVHQPLTLQLFNEDNPYEKAYNVTSLQVQEHSAKIRSNLTVEVTQSAGVVKDCICISPLGQRFSINDDLQNYIPNGVYLSKSNTKAICEIHFYDFTEEMEGKWQIIGKFQNNLLFDERRLTFHIIIEDVSLSQITHYTKIDASIEISLSKQSYEEDCYVRPPYGEKIKAEVSIPGVKVEKSSQFVSCRITIGPMKEDLLGVWRVCGKSTANQEIRCQPVRVTWDRLNGTLGWDIQNRSPVTHPVHLKGSVNSGVSEFSGNIETCHVLTPAKEDLVITTDAHYPHIERSGGPCNVIITDITRDMLGDWLIYGIFRPIFGQDEVRQPLVFKLYDEDNPYDQAYNVTELPSQNHLIHVGTNLSVEVRERTGKTEDCIYISPSGQRFSTNSNNTLTPEGINFKSTNDEAFCQIIFNPITENTTGEWLIAAKFRNVALFNERHLTFRVIVEDPMNPLEDGIEREIRNLTEQFIVTDLNTTHRIVVDDDILYKIETCHLIAPDGRQYAFIDGFNVPNIEIINDVNCGINLGVNDESMIGNWTIFGRGTTSRPIAHFERRRLFVIRVEENFVLHDDINIREGGDLYLHMNEAIPQPETCILYGPDGQEFTDFEIDTAHVPTCGYIVRNVEDSHNGTWVIEYGKKIKIRGHIDVNVLDSDQFIVEHLRWTVGDPINISVGPNNAVYCLLKDPFGHKLFDNFGQCRIVIDRVNIDHNGFWTIHVGKPGTVRLQEFQMHVEVRTTDTVPLISSTVEETKFASILTCSVPAEHKVHACQFRDPLGNILVAASGVGHDRYMFNGSAVNYESDTHSHDCTLRIINASAADLGIWRCGMDTSTGTHYGFLTVLNSLMQISDDADTVVTEPKLTDTSIAYMEGEPVTLSCSIPAALRYCYFRAYNGTAYNVFPRMPSSGNFEYVGAGLDAGECGIRFKRLSAVETPFWTCHVGLVNTSTSELWTDVHANVKERMLVHHYWNGTNSVVVEAVVHNRNPLEYCRFLKKNGQGFHSDNVPARYAIAPTLDRGVCALQISDPDFIDLNPWTIVVKLKIADGEISMTTTENLLLKPPVYSSFVAEIFFWLLIAFVCMIPLLAVIACIPKKNREWTTRRAHRMRRSFRHSWSKAFAKKPPLPAAA